MKMDINQEKVKKMSVNLRVIMQIFYWVGVIGVVGLSIAFIVVSALPENKFIVSAGSSENMGFSLEGIVSYRLNAQTAVGLSLKPIYQSICLMAAIISVGLSIIFKQIINMLRTVEVNRPFSQENSRCLTIIGYILIIGSCVIRIVEGVVARAIIHTLNIQNMQVNFSVDGFMMISGFLMLILAGIFKYGNYLQQEYDTTL